MVSIWSAFGQMGSTSGGHLVGGWSVLVKQWCADGWHVVSWDQPVMIFWSAGGQLGSTSGEHLVGGWTHGINQELVDAWRVDGYILKIGLKCIQKKGLI